MEANEPVTRTEIITGVSPSLLDNVIKMFKAAGANVTAKPQADGNYRLEAEISTTAVYPASGENVYLGSRR